MNGWAICGTPTQYRYGCRCDLCRAAKAAAWDQYQSKKRQQINERALAAYHRKAL